MINRFLLVSACLILPTASLAGPIVTWEAFGVTTYAYSQYPGWPNVAQSPPLGTTYSVQLTFDPSARQPTGSAPAGAPCYQTPVTGTFDLGGAGYSVSGLAFTDARLPSTNCAEGTIPNYPPGAIEFFLDPISLGPDPWQLNREPSFLLFSYFDSVFQDGTFPGTPSPVRPGFLLYRLNDNFEFGAPFVPQAVDQSTPVPEPGTMTLFGLGLAAVARKVRRSRR